MTDSGSDVLKKRGNLTPEQIHALAHKGKKAACHSDNVEEAGEAKLVQLNTLKARGVSRNVCTTVRRQKRTSGITPGLG